MYGSGRFVEVLEGRRLLSGVGSAAEDGGSAGGDGAWDFEVGLSQHTLTAEQMAEHGLVSVEWQGQMIYAVAGEWIVGVRRDGPTEWAGPATPADEGVRAVLGASDLPLQFEHYLGTWDSFLIKAPADATYDQVAGALAGLDGLEYVEPNGVVAEDLNDAASLLPASYRPVVESLGVGAGAGGDVRAGQPTAVTVGLSGVTRTEYRLQLFLTYYPGDAGAGVLLGTAVADPVEGTERATVRFEGAVLPEGVGRLEVTAPFNLMDAYSVPVTVMPAVPATKSGEVSGQGATDASEEVGEASVPGSEREPELDSQLAVGGDGSGPAIGAGDNPVGVVQVGGKGTVGVTLAGKSTKAVTLYWTADEKWNRGDVRFSRQLIKGKGGETGGVREVGYRVTRGVPVGTGYVIAVAGGRVVGAEAVEVKGPRLVASVVSGGKGVVGVRVGNEGEVGAAGVAVVRVVDEDGREVGRVRRKLVLEAGEGVVVKVRVRGAGKGWRAVAG